MRMSLVASMDESKLLEPPPCHTGGSGRLPLAFTQAQFSLLTYLKIYLQCHGFFPH